MTDNKNLRMAATAFALSLMVGCASAPEPKPAPVSEPQPASEPEPQPKPEPAPVVVRPDHPREYVVVKGDTLWDIAARFLRDPWRWPEVWQDNPQVRNPHLIYPGDVLRLVYIEGKPTIQVQRGARRRPSEGEQPAQVGRIEPPPPQIGKTVKLSPRIRVEELEQAIPTIPMDAIRQFLERNRVVSDEELERAPYVLTTPDEHLIAGGRGQRLYVRGLESSDYSRYAVVRRGKPYYDPRRDEVIGHEAIFLADAHVVRSGDPATMVIEDSKREILKGDRLLPIDEAIIDRSFMPHAPDQDVKGQIISVVEGVTRIGQYQIVALNLGLQDDIEPGHVLAVYQTGREVTDPVNGDDVMLPNERAGTVLVFRTFDQLSYALVMNAKRTIRVHDMVTNP